MVEVLIAMLPIGLLMAIGWSLNLMDFPGATFWPLLDRLIYFVLLPALLVRTAMGTDIGVLVAAPIGLTVVVALLATTALLIALRGFTASTGAAFSSVVQGAIRVNVYAGFAIASALYGDRGVVLFSVVIAFAVPLDNLLSIGALRVFASAEKQSLLTVVMQVFVNPLILSLAFGYGLRGLDVAIPNSLLTTLELVGSATLPLALMAVGANFRGQVRGAEVRPLASAVLARQLALPSIAYGVSLAAGLSGTQLAMVMLHASLPTGPGAYIVARRMGGDAPLMASIIVGTTFAAVFAVPFWLGIVIT